ncbi:MAG: YIP1 family protein [Nitrospirota bacterium]
MDYSKRWNNLVSVLKLDREAMSRVANDKSATLCGVLILFVVPVINLILASFTFSSGFGVMFSRVMFWPMFIPVISIFCIIFLMNFIAIRFFGGKGNSVGFFRTVSYSSAVLWLSIVPYILSIFGILDPMGLYNLIMLVGLIWIAVVSYYMLMEHHKLSAKDAGTVVALGIIGYFLFRNILGRILVGSYYRWF